MNSDVEYLRKDDAALYADFIKTIFDYDINNETIEQLIQKNKVLIIKKKDKIIASVTIEERFEYIKNKKYYLITYLGVLREYRREGYASKLFDEIERLVKENNIDYIELSSGNQRRFAYYFYKSKNFKIKDSTVFIKMYN